MELSLFGIKITCLVDNANTDLVSRFEQKLMWKKETFGALSRLRQ